MAVIGAACVPAIVAAPAEAANGNDRGVAPPVTSKLAFSPAFVPLKITVYFAVSPPASICGVEGVTVKSPLFVPTSGFVTKVSVTFLVFATEISPCI